MMMGRVASSVFGTIIFMFETIPQDVCNQCRIPALQAIQKSHQDVEDCFTAMLCHWLKHSSPPPSLLTLMEALKSPSINRCDLVEDIQAKWGSEYSEEQ